MRKWNANDVAQFLGWLRLGHLVPLFCKIITSGEFLLLLNPK